MSKSSISGSYDRFILILFKFILFDGTVTSPELLLFLVCFSDKVLYFFQAIDLSTFTFRVARIKGIYHHAQLLFKHRVSPTFCLDWPQTVILLSQLWQWLGL
jgi:hypothetical protein